MNIKRQTVNCFTVCCLFLFASLISAFAQSQCIKFKDSYGSGEYPYNCRFIDKCFFAGGSLFNPEKGRSNSADKVDSYVRWLKANGVKTIISLNVPLKHDKFILILSDICKKNGIKHMLMRMNSETVPNEEQTKIIMDALKKGAYVHCMWGCDRTGAIVAKYLRECRGYTGEKAFEAVIKDGSHAGYRGGFKKTKNNNKLIKYFWAHGPQY